MNIIKADHLGMCFGVRDAIALARAKAQEQPLTILGELVHNESVLTDLRRDGIRIETDPAQVHTPRAMITAHGASERAKAHARAHGFELFEGTCPLVTVAHRAVARLVAEGYHPVIIGKRGHVEVRGLTEDLETYDIIESEADIDRLIPRPRFGVASQTTQPIARVRELVAKIRERFPASELRFIDTVCQPTKQRQNAAEQLAAKCDIVIVIGGANSNNTRELVQTCSRFCDRVHHVQSAADLRADWFQPNDTVGITAGTSTPDYLIEAVEHAVHELHIAEPAVV
ncbi:MAG TPA: 4-hydroxy-3-methylbut-2-enyl diphosphate reductase [Verrucomicrobiae bacterium]